MVEKEITTMRPEFEALLKYATSPPDGNICILNGFPETGKTTMLRKLLEKFDEKETAYKFFNPDTAYKFLDATKQFIEDGKKTIILDGASFSADFQKDAVSLLLLCYQKKIKIILTGGYSLALSIANDITLCGKCVYIDMNNLPFSTYQLIMPNINKESYYSFGGTLLIGDDSQFSNTVNYKKHIDDLATNILESTESYYSHKDRWWAYNYYSKEQFSEKLYDILDYFSLCELKRVVDKGIEEKTLIKGNDYNVNRYLYNVSIYLNSKIEAKTFKPDEILVLSSLLETLGILSHLPDKTYFLMPGYVSYHTRMLIDELGSVISIVPILNNEFLSGVEELENEIWMNCLDQCVIDKNMLIETKFNFKDD